MSVSVHLNGKFFLSSKEAARLSGYTSDYVARLARHGKISGTRVGTQWFVEPKSLEDFLQFADTTRTERSKQLQQERRRERDKVAAISLSDSISNVDSSKFSTAPAELVNLAHRSHSLHTHAKALAIVASGFALALLIAIPHDVSRLAAPASISLSSVRSFAYNLYHAVYGDSARPFLSQNEQGNDHGTVNVVSGGIVVLPGDTSSTTLEYIKNSFSDEVKVSLDDSGVTGKITPVFKDGTGDPYRFVVVPIEQSPKQSP